MTLNAATGATPSQDAVDQQIQRGIDLETLLTPAQVAVELAAAYDTYSKEGILSGGDLSVGGTKSLLDSGFVTDNTTATIQSIAEGICNYWSSNNTPGTPTHGGTAVQSVTIDGASKIPAMVAAITGATSGGWEGFYAATEAVVKTIPCVIVELIPPFSTPTPFPETIS